MEKSTFTVEYRLLRTMVREKRKAAGLTQIDLAERLNETQSYVSKVERGERRVDLVQLQSFCKGIGLSLVEFVKEYEQRSLRRPKR